MPYEERELEMFQQSKLISFGIKEKNKQIVQRLGIVESSVTKDEGQKCTSRNAAVVTVVVN